VLLLELHPLTESFLLVQVYETAVLYCEESRIFILNEM
jgi:hypothetical protein